MTRLSYESWHEDAISLCLATRGNSRILASYNLTGNDALDHVRADLSVHAF